MNAIERLDLAILGGGCAGLSVARELALQATQKKVIVLEARDRYLDDRSWCFWSLDQHKFSKLVSHTWPNWKYSRQFQPVRSRNCSGNLYQYIRSSDFYRDSHEIIEQSPSINLRLGSCVTSVAKLSHGWQIVTPDQIYIADQVIDTRPATGVMLEQPLLYQCFLGVEIQLDAPTNVDLDYFELMTDMRVVNEEFCFTYILPLSTDRFLVEVTFFSRCILTREDLHKDLEQLLSHRGWSNASILRTEYGNLPMGLPGMSDGQKSESNPLVHAGIRGGALRASSGYAFLRIQRWAEQCAIQFNKSGTLYSKSSSGFWLKQMDHLFLKVIKKNPGIAPILFEQLLSSNQTARFLRFMNDQASFLDCLYIIARLPKIPFIQAVLSSLWAKR